MKVPLPAQLAAGLTVLAIGAAAAPAAVAAPRLQVSASASKTTLAVRIKPSTSGTVAIAVKAPNKAMVAKRSVKLAGGKVRTLKFATATCKKCTKVRVTGTLKTAGGKPVSTTVVVTLPTTTPQDTTPQDTTPAATALRTTTTGATAPTAPTPTPPPAAEQATTPAPTVPPASGSTGTVTDKLTWAPPALTNPITITVSASNRSVHLDGNKDYVIKMPATALTGAGGLTIVGGRNVVLIGGEIDIPWQGATPPVNSRRGLYLQNQTGTVHIEGLSIHGADLSEGIDLDQRKGATVQIQNTRVEGVHARDETNFTDNHPDVIQTWAGPKVLRVDHFSGSSDYQGFFFAPMQFGTTQPTLFDLRNVDISAVRRNNELFAGYLLWQASSFPMSLRNFYVTPDARKGLPGSQYPRMGAWTAAQPGAPAVGSYAPAAALGTGYRTAGYITP
jgi:hypothetical protein